MPATFSNANPILSQSMLVVGFLFGWLLLVQPYLNVLRISVAGKSIGQKYYCAFTLLMGRTWQQVPPTGLPCPESVKGSVLKMKSVENGV